MFVSHCHSRYSYGGTWKQRSLHNHLCKDAPNRPDVNGRRVIPGAKKDLGGTIPKSNYFMSVRSQRDSKSTSKAKVGEFESAMSINEKVLGLEVTVQYPMGMAVCNASQ